MANFSKILFYPEFFFFLKGRIQTYLKKKKNEVTSNSQHKFNCERLTPSKSDRLSAFLKHCVIKTKWMAHFFSALPLQMNQKGRTGFQERVSQQDSMTAFMEQYSNPSPDRVQWEGPCQSVCHHMRLCSRASQAQSHPLLLAGVGGDSSLLLLPSPLSYTEDASHARGPISVQFSFLTHLSFP